MRFARWVYAIAGVLGILMVTPMFFREGEMAPDNSFPIFYYGFAAVTLAWQVLFLLLATDPLRHRPLMPASLLEKGGFVLVVLWLYAGGRVTDPMWLFAAAIDGVLGVLFAAAYIATRSRPV